MTVGEAVFLTRAGAVATIHLNRPDRRNAINVAMWRQLARFVDVVEKDSAVRVIVVTGESGAFAAGSDIEEFGRLAGDPAAAADAADVLHHAERTLYRAGKPTLAMIRGACIGAGCGIALCCDVRFADSTARFGITPARLGLVYGVADTKRLVDVVGAARARDLLLTGRILDAAEALEMGLVTKVTPSTGLDGAVAEYTALLTDASAFSQRTMKRHIGMVCDGAADDTEDSLRVFTEAVGGSDFKEGHAAFMAKRKPVFPS